MGPGDAETEGQHDVPFYSVVPAPEVSEDEVLSLYAIYRNVSRGDTFEPWESRYQAAEAAKRESGQKPADDAA